jgi:hypothetical protein
MGRFFMTDTFYFRGFQKPTYTQIPDEFFDELMPNLKEAELRVLLYIMRRTFGFKKLGDTISISQFLKGITTKSGEKLDGGCGIKSPTALSRALKNLEQMGIITATKSEDAVHGLKTTHYGLRFTEGVLSEVEYPTPRNGVGYYPKWSNNKQTDKKQIRVFERHFWLWKVLIESSKARRFDFFAHLWRAKLIEEKRCQS